MEGVFLNFNDLNKELAKKGILMRKFGQEIIKALAGKKIHGILAVPGGVHKTFTKEERQYFLDGIQIPTIDTMIQWSKEIIDFMKVLIYLYVETYLYKKKEFQRLKDILKNLLV